MENSVAGKNSLSLANSADQESVSEQAVYSSLEGVSEEFSQIFGNYLLHGIAEVELPDTISWFPQTIGWKILAALVVACAVYRILLLIRHWHQNRYRRDAIRLITELSKESDDYQQVLEALPKILKFTALQAYPRASVAQLSGTHWLQFLDGQYSGPKFNDRLGLELLRINYQPNSSHKLDVDDRKMLVEMATLWIRKHVPAEVSL